MSELPDRPKPYDDCLGDCGENGMYCCDGGWDGKAVDGMDVSERKLRDLAVQAVMDALSWMPPDIGKRYMQEASYLRFKEAVARPSTDTGAVSADELADALSDVLNHYILSDAPEEAVFNRAVELLDRMADHPRVAVCHTCEPATGASTNSANEVERLREALRHAHDEFEQLAVDMRGVAADLTGETHDYLLDTACPRAREAQQAIQRVLDEDQLGGAVTDAAETTGQGAAGGPGAPEPVQLQEPHAATQVGAPADATTETRSGLSRESREEDADGPR